MSPPGPYLMISGLKFFLDVGRITVKIDGLAAFFLASPFLIWASASGTNPIIFHCLPGRYQAFLKAFLCRKKDLFSIKMGKVNAIYFQQYIMFSLIFKYMDCCSEIVSDLNKINNHTTIFVLLLNNPSQYSLYKNYNTYNKVFSNLCS